MRCPHCGKEISENANFCRYCGGRTGHTLGEGGQYYVEKPLGCLGGGGIVLGNLMSGFILGVVLYIVWKEIKPRTAKTIGIITLVEFAFSLVVLPFFMMLSRFLLESVFHLF